jgi:hypothetical protein
MGKSGQMGDSDECLDQQRNLLERLRDLSVNPTEFDDRRTKCINLDLIELDFAPADIRI